MTTLRDEMMVSYYLYDSGASLDIVRDDEGRVRLERAPDPAAQAAALGPGAYRDIYAISEAADAPVSEQEVAGTMGGVVPGVGIGAATGIQDVGALAYGGFKAATAEEGQRIDEFLKGFSAISGAIGSEKAFEIFNAGIDMLPISDEAKQGLKQGAMVGEGVGGFGVAGQAGKGVVQGAKTYAAGAPQRIADRTSGTMFGAGMDPTAPIDEAIVAGQKLLKEGKGPTAENPVAVAPPTETEPGIIAFHGSSADFDQFSLEKIGTGEGAQAYGYGLYFTDSEDIAKYYRSAVSGMDRFNQPDLDTQAGGFTQELGFDTVGGTHSLSSADPEYDYYIGELDNFAVNKSENLSENSKTWEFADGSELTLQTEGVMTFDGKPLDSVYTRDVEDRFGADIKRIAEEAKKMGIRDDVGTLEDDIGVIFSNLGQGIFNKRDAKAAVESLAGPSGPGAPSRYETIYSYFIEPKIDMTRVDYLMNAGQKKGKMYKVGLEPKPEDMLDYDTPLNQQPRPVQKMMENLVGDLLVGEPEAYDRFDFKALAAIMGESPTEGYSPTGEDILTDLQRFFEVQDFQNELYGRGDRLASEMMYDFGIPGIKYRAAGSRGAGVDDAAAKRNYVIFDDKAIKILEKYGIVGPVAVTAIAGAQQQEGNDNGA